MSDASAHTWSYRPGSWFAVVGPVVSVLLPAAAKHRVPEIWSLVDDGAAFDDVLDALLVGSGLGGLPDFAVLESSAGSVTIVVRGPSVRARVVVAGEPQPEVDASTARTWVERHFTTVDSLAILVADAGDAADTPDGDAEHGAADLPLPAGLVRVARLERRTSTAPRPDTEVPAAVTGPPTTEPYDVLAPGQPEPEPESESEPAELSSLSFPIPPPLQPLPAADADPSAEESSEESVEACSEEEIDHDGLTQTGLLTGDLLAVPADSSGHSGTTNGVTVARLEVGADEVVDVDRVVLIGRAPEARRAAGADEPRLVTVRSPLQEISSTHVEVRPGSGVDHGSAVVTDLGSTNGTVLEQPGLGPEELRPGISVQLLPGSVIHLGDGVAIRVTRP